MDLFTPSLHLLLLKTISVFIISFLAGRSLINKPLFNNRLVHLIATTGLGIAYLNMAVIIASFSGGVGWYGLLLPLTTILYRGYLWLKSPAHITFYRSGFIFILLTAMCCLNYLMPFALNTTSGFYSRGGGDHSTYISLSDWFVNHRFWSDIPHDETIPPGPYFELKSLLKMRQHFSWTNVQPLANQYLATPYMAILPGHVEETYTAVVAFYMAMAAWSVLAFLSLLGQWDEKQLLQSSPLVLCSNLLLYLCTTHSTSALLSVTLFYCALTGYIQLIRMNTWHVQSYEFLYVTLLTGSLFAIYPHLFLIGVFFFLFFICGISHPIARRNLFVFLGWNILGIVLLTNLALLINIPLICSTVRISGGALTDYHWTQVLSTLMGVIDFGLYTPESASSHHQWLILGGVSNAILIVFLVLGLYYFPFRTACALAACCFLYLTGTFYYQYKAFSYQTIRFTEYGSLLYLGLSGFGLAQWMRRSQSYHQYTAYVLLGCLLIAMQTAHSFAIREVLGLVPSSQTEFRDAPQFQMAEDLLKLQQSSPSGHNRIIYYFGPGYGVDHAGMSTLLRPLSYLAAFGYSYDPIFDREREGARVWNTSWLQDAILVINPPSMGDILVDRRPEASYSQIKPYSFLHVIDTSNQVYSTMLGDSWNAPQEYTHPEYKTFRMLRGKPGALTIWSRQPEYLKIKVVAHADRNNMILRFSGQCLIQQLEIPLQMWNHTFESEYTTDIEIHTQAGPNVILFEPQGTDTVPWIYFWSIVIDPFEP